MCNWTLGIEKKKLFNTFKVSLIYKNIPTTQSQSYTPALLQSTLKLFFWPMKPLVRPRPLATTLLASDRVGAPCWEQLMARVTGSTMTEEVSCILWLDTSLEPGRWRRDCLRHLYSVFFFVTLFIDFHNYTNSNPDPTHPEVHITHTASNLK